MDLNTIRSVERPAAREALPAWRDGDAFLAGGTWLFSEPQPALTRLIDLSALGWTPLEATDDGLTLAATCTVAQLDAFVAPPAWIAAPLIGQCCRAFLASFKIWNSATVGGNLCIALPAGPIIALACALEATCTLWRPQSDARTLAARDFVKGPQQTALMPGELLRAFTLPAAALKKRIAFRQISLSPLGRSGALVIGTLGADGFMLTITAATPAPVVLHFDAMPSGTALRQAIETAVPRWYDDVHGLPAWRHAMTLHLAGEILAELGGAT